MKRLIASGVCGLLLTALVNQAGAQSKSSFFPSNVLPPPNSMYISPAQWHALYANGVIISNVTHRGFQESLPPPPSGTSATHTFGSELDFDLSLDHGRSFTRVSAPAMVTVNLQAVSISGGQQVYNTEMLQLNISGGTLPGGTQIRASTSQPSTGQTVVGPVTGGFLISSFFDIFTEVSLDGGQTWSASPQSGHVELRPDPALVTPAPESTPLVPPQSDQYVTPTQSTAAFPGGIIIKDVHHKFPSQAINPLTLGLGAGKTTEQFGANINFQLSTDGGNTFNPMQAPATVTVTLQNVNPGPPTVFDTEMTQLDLSFLVGTATLRLRESPTLPSYGETAVQQMADGSFLVNSFFDIFTELSTDGGQSWQPHTTGPTHAELQRTATVSKFLTPNLPPTNGQFSLPTLVRYPGGVVLSNFNLHNLVPAQAPPPPGQNQPQTFEASADMMLSLDNGQTFNPASAPASGFLTISNTSPAGGGTGSAQYYNTELMSLSISGGTLPQGLMIRESPSKASLGRTSSLQDAAGGFRICSFFDVFTELSLNGGASWNAALTDPSTIPLVPRPPYAPYVITCPSNITVYATGPSGAVVNYTFPPIVIFPDCPFCCFTATGVPPSGSLFPIGTTTVTGYGSDGCGEHPTCTFTVTVLPSLIYAGLADIALAKALLQPDVGTNQFSPNPLTISNITTSGADGFHLYLGSVDSVLLNFQPFPTTVNCPTDWYAYATSPSSPASDQQTGAGVYDGGSNAMIRADFSALGATSVILEVHDDDNHLISSNSIANNSLVSVVNLFPPPCSNYNAVTYSYSQSPDHICYRFCMFGCNCLGTNCYIERIACLRPDIARLPLQSFLSDLQFQPRAGAGTGTLTIQSEEIGMFGLMHRAMGQATFEAHPGSLQLNNLGSSGQDGVSVNLTHLGEFDMMLAPTMIENGGACWQMSLLGTVNGMEDSLIGSMMLVHSVGPGGGCQVSDNFQGLGGTLTRVEIYQGTQLTGSVTSSNGFLGTMPSHGNLIGAGTLLPPMPGFRASFDSSFVFISAQGGQFTGNEIHVMAVDPHAAVQGITRFAAGGCGIGQFAILGERAQPTFTGILRRSDGSYELDCQGAARVMYRLLAAPTLGGTTQWSPIGSAMSGLDGTLHLLDTRGGAMQQFYRVVTP